MTAAGTPPNWRDFSVPALPPLLGAALDCFVEHGYHGTAIRTVATHAGLSVPGLYHHYPSKQALLVGIAESAMADLYARSSAALREAGEDVEARFALLVECLVLVHAYRWEHAFIAASEIRSLEGPARAGHIAARDRQQKLLDDVVAEGSRLGRFATRYPKDASRAVTTMCTGVAQWYRAGGPLSPEELAARYVQICRGTVQAR
ncbi:TetR/AcrR family transcriptional regulator [Arthrobacter zhangbolii]|uniref:TetR/AcrR family transcriptional regulator n=1 Tax=Arthrobacter zhangbolii TaxID=2886936 RepID=A0A9X1M7N4_9MICC|nr:MULTISPECIES: TetR/AcrR family transcriptional regulator [Arthrobacter]MCC3272390.1 TetR/AcrR family transcriptional regulator [Arthrobacter zhangbolii]MCC3294128.1 TetR/AcrR family transcriptional regulator [Arthrobacter zhangbolii]MDN3903455.1 TetR/AcrR family transcriptional regulator [Arthrobacter sp. YD2]UON91748.1 TetR/AcrR family transcriptional regulator [Arthrobacter zhangbolii]